MTPLARAVLLTCALSFLSSDALPLRLRRRPDSRCNKGNNSLCDPDDPRASKILITGSGGSGTHSVAKLFQLNGIELGHESVWEHGAVSWPYAVDISGSDFFHSDCVQNSSFLMPAKTKFQHVFHLVRCPLDTISAMLSHQQCPLEYLRHSLGLGGNDPDDTRQSKAKTPKGIRFRAKAWLEMSRHMDWIAERRYQIEQVSELYHDVCRRTGFPEETCNASRLPNRMVNRRNKNSLSWKDLQDADAELADAVRRKAIEYGFGTECIEDDSQGTVFSEVKAEDKLTTMGMPGSSCDTSDTAECVDGALHIEWEWDMPVVKALIADHPELLPSYADYGLVDPGVDEIEQNSTNLCIDGRLAPEFFLIGAQKSATTTFCSEELNASSAIITAHMSKSDSASQNHSRLDNGSSIKELHIFDTEGQFARGRTAWLSHYPKCSQDTRAVAVDCTPSYLRHEHIPSRIAAWYGKKAQDLTFMILLREPMKRMQSAFYYDKANFIDYEPYINLPPTFQEYVSEVLSRAKRGDMLQQDSEFDRPLTGSLYTRQIETYFDVFSPSQFIFVPFLFEVAPANGTQTVAQHVFEKLGIDGPQVKMVAENQNPHPPLEKDLDAASHAGLTALLEKHAGAMSIARMLASREGAQLHGYTGRSNDTAAIYKWLSTNW